MFIPLMSIGQEKNPVITISGVEPVVVNIPNKNAQEIYDNLKIWVIQSYVNPAKVLMADIPDSQIRINGYDDNFFQGKGMTVFNMAVDYMLTIDIQDNKYRFTIEIGKITYDNGTPYNMGTQWWFKKKDGSLKKGATMQYESINKSLKQLNTSIYNAATGATQKTKDDW